MHPAAPGSIQSRSLQTSTNMHLVQQPLPAWLQAPLFALWGIGAALALAWCMYTLVFTAEMQLADGARTPHMLDFVRLQRDEVTVRKRQKPKRPPVNEMPEVLNPTDSRPDIGMTLGVDLGLSPTVVTELQTDLGFGDGDYMPIVRIAPVYPQRASANGWTGTCVVSFTVTTAGTVKDVQIVEDKCVQTVFQRVSVEAAERFRYKPRIVDGQPVEVHGVTNRFVFAENPDD